MSTANEVVAAVEDDDPQAYDDLTALLRVEGPRLAEADGKLRVYRVIVGKVVRYAVSNSPGNAALCACDVDVVPPKAVAQAAFRVIGEKATA